VDGSLDDKTLCKFGVTINDPDKRRSAHEATFKRKFDVGIDLELAFLVSGLAPILEEQVRHRTKKWNPDFFDARKSEWRVCPVAELIQVVRKEMDRMRYTFEIIHELRPKR
jgi:hypothetical protein